MGCTLEHDAEREFAIVDPVENDIVFRRAPNSTSAALWPPSVPLW